MRQELETTIAFYDQQYAESTAHLDMQKLYDRFEMYLPTGANILDAGCGSGRDSKYFLEKGYKVIAFDASDIMCECASKLIVQEVRKLSFQQLDYNECFDGVWACASLLHVPEDEIIYVLKKITDAMKKNGILYASWKYGDKERVDNATKRYFCDMNEKKIVDFINSIANLEICECWFTNDVRNDFTTHSWLNILAKKI